MNELISQIIGIMPIGIIVYNEAVQTIFCNKKAQFFLKRHELPDEITTIAKRMFSALKSSRFNEQFPGEIYLYKKIEPSPSRWVFKLDIAYSGQPQKPAVIVFITEETVANGIDLLEARQIFKLTRRETDVLRRVFSGLKNAEIAEDLEISEQTVKDHLSNIYMKVGVENRFTLAQALMNFGNTDAPN